jgi:hypothetical protein
MFSFLSNAFETFIGWLLRKVLAAKLPEETPEQRMTIHLFFHGAQGVAKPLFAGKIKADQVAGCERIIKAFDLYRPGGTLEQLAYILATAYHETGRRMQPVREAFGTSTADTIARLDSAWEKGQLTWVKEPYWRDGYFGRGHVQLTHKANYIGALAKAVYERFDVRLISEPDLALDPQISAFILVEGMCRGVTLKGDFTAYALEDFVNETKVDYKNARKTVNPGDMPTYLTIQTYAQFFEAALRNANYAPATQR